MLFRHRTIILQTRAYVVHYSRRYCNDVLRVWSCIDAELLACPMWVVKTAFNWIINVRIGTEHKMDDGFTSVLTTSRCTYIVSFHLNPAGWVPSLPEDVKQTYNTPSDVMQEMPGSIRSLYVHQLTLLPAAESVHSVNGNGRVYQSWMICYVWTMYYLK